jgi:protein-arginine kinase activator protein McsA
MSNFKLVPVESVIDSVLVRLKSGLHFDSNLKPYRRDFLESILDSLLKRERYEDCAFMRDIIKNRFDNHAERFKRY